MKNIKTFAFGLFFTTLFASSCNSINNPVPVPVPVKDMKTPQGGSSTVGNGLKLFEDNNLELGFNYPENWTAIQGVDGWTLNYISDRKVEVEIKLQSNVDLGYLKFEDTPQLASYLQSVYPNRAWNQASLIHDRTGFGSEVKKSQGIDGQYYFINKSDELIHLEFWLDQDGNQNSALRDIFKQVKLSVQP